MENQEQLRDKVVEWLRMNLKKRSDLNRPANSGARGNFYNAYAKNHPEILDLAFGPVIDTTIENKKKLMQLNNRPSSMSKDSEEGKLGRALINYTRKKSGVYDSEFDKLIRKIKPKWFIDTAAEKKKKILGLEYRPSCSAKDIEERSLGMALSCYTRKTSATYDLIFDKLIRKTKPDWFIDTAIENKKELLKLRDRPSPRSRYQKERKLGGALYSYTRSSSRSYDQEFDKLIRKAKPEWFIDKVIENKETLLKLRVRPSQRSKNPKEKRLGRTLAAYICKTHRSYDAEFDKLIRKTNPHWFK